MDADSGRTNQPSGVCAGPSSPIQVTDLNTL